MKKLLVLIAATAPFAANAGDFNYSFIDLGYARADNSNYQGSTFDGLSFEGSWGFGDMWIVDVDYLDGSGDTTQYEVGFGAHFDLASDLDAIARVNYIDAETGASSEWDGYGIDLGLRGTLGDNMEWTATHSYRALEDDQDATINDHSTIVGVLYHFANAFSFGVDSTFNSINGDAYNIFGRYNF